MGKLVVTEFLTLDGVAQAPGGPDEDRDGTFTHGGWQAPLLDDDAGAVMFEQARRMDALVLGRRTYEIFARYWPSAPDDIPFTGLLNGVPSTSPAGRWPVRSPGKVRRSSTPSS
jgi:dihydrofolate reductase